MIELRAPEEAVEVLLEMPHRGAPGGLVRPDALEDPAAVMQRVREHVDLGIRPIHELAIHPDLLDLGDGHRELLLVMERAPHQGRHKDTDRRALLRGHQGRS